MHPWKTLSRWSASARRGDTVRFGGPLLSSFYMAFQDVPEDTICEARLGIATSQLLHPTVFSDVLL